MAIALVQHITGSNPSNSGPATATFVSSVISGNLIVVGAAISINTANTITSITDTAGNTYTRVTSNIDGSGGECELWYAKNVIGGASFKVTANFGITFAGTIAIREYSGLDKTAPLDVFTSTGSSFGTAISSGASAATTVANELVLGVSSDEGSGTPTVSLGAGYTNLDTVRATGTGAALPLVSMEDKIIAATGSQIATFTGSVNGNWVCIVATFKIAGVAPTAHNLTLLGIGA